jgi:LuxR family transcriptional regulator, maltose regulon positive regulatory protein
LLEPAEASILEIDPRRSPHPCRMMDAALHSGIDTARAHLAAGDWELARAAFQAALAGEETPEALEGLGLAHWWLDEADASCRAQEGAYRLYLERDDRRSAARVATLLARAYAEYRGEDAVGSGWLRRARRLLEDAPPCEEQGWLHYVEGLLHLFERLDVEAARTAGERAAAIGRRVESIDVEMLGIALEGLALVTEGRVRDGMLRLDEASAAVVAGEVSDRAAAGDACCLMIFGCERVRDFERAAQWCRHIRALAERIGQRSYLAVCHTHYAAVLMSRGEWIEAEHLLEAASADLGETYLGMLPEALARFGELRRRQGRLEEAEDLLRRAESHPYARVSLGRIALDRGEHLVAIGRFRALLRQLPEADVTTRAAVLEPLFEACLAAGLRAEAVEVASELTRAAQSLGTSALRAAAHRTEGLLAEARGDLEAAARAMEDAANLLAGTGTPFETAQVRLELARILTRVGRTGESERQEAIARKLFSALGAVHMIRRLEDARSDEDGSREEGDSGSVSPLTPRQTEVLRLVADGLTNGEVAQRLILSEHTVHRHMANILTKLGAPSRAAAVAAAAREHLL